MGRSSGWPPNSAAEWVVGQNFRSWGHKTSSGSNPILRVEISEDEASGDETVAITYPGRRRRAESAQHASPATTSARKVRFDGAHRPLKSAMKKRASPDSSSDTLVDTSEDDDRTTSPGDGESSGLDETDTSEDESPPRRKSNRKNKNKKAGRAKTVVCRKVTEWGPDAVDDPLPDPGCPCDDCTKARKVMKAMVQFEAMAKAVERGAKAKHKAKHKGSKKAEVSSTDVTDDDDTTTTTSATVTETDADTTEADTTQGESVEEEKPKPQKGKKKKSSQKKPSKRKGKAAPEHAPEPTAAEEPRKAAQRTSFKMPQYPKEMQPNLIMPPRARVMQVEHTIEGPNDPQPNAFFDSAKGITRVYHGPQWGNHMAELYGNYNPSRVAPGPCAAIPPPPHPPPHPPPPPAAAAAAAAAAHPPPPPLPPGYPAAWPGQSAYHPWWMPPPPPPPPGAPFAQAALHPPQMPSNEAAMREAASKGFGLSGMAAAEVPNHIQEMQKKEAQKAASREADSDKGSKKDGWSAPSWGAQGNQNNGNAPKSDPEAKAPADPSPQGGDGWGSYDHKKNGCSSPYNFNSWGNANEDTFSRKSNQNGSQKAGSGKQDSSSACSPPELSPRDSPKENVPPVLLDSRHEEAPGDTSKDTEPDCPPGFSAVSSAFDLSCERPADQSQAGGGWGGNGQNHQQGGGSDRNNNQSNNPWGNSDDNQNNTWGERKSNNGDPARGWPGEAKKPSPQQQPAPWDSGSNAGRNGNGNGGCPPVPGAWDSNEQNNNPNGSGGGTDRGSPSSKPKGAFPWPGSMGPPPDSSRHQADHHRNGRRHSPPGSQTGDQNGFGAGQQNGWGGSDQGGGGLPPWGDSSHGWANKNGPGPAPA